MARVMIAAVFFVLLMTLGASAVSYQGDALGNQYDIDGETADADGAGFVAGEEVNLTNSHNPDAVYDPGGQTAVQDENGVLAVEGTDYDWNQNNGTITILEGGNLEGDANLTADYSFHVPTQRQKDIVTYVGGQMEVANAMVYALAAIIGVAFLKLLAGASP